MIFMGMAMRVARIAETVVSIEDLGAAMADIATALGFKYFALSHHGDITAARGHAIRVHNYPAQWADYYDRHALGICDPVHRASQVTSIGFPWRRMRYMVPLTAMDDRVLALGQAAGIGDGFTVPAHIPGEAIGSCSFANEAGRPLPEAMFPLAQLVGTYAFEAARRLRGGRGYRQPGHLPLLTDRQRDCVVLAGAGKSDWESSRILGLSEETVTRHIRHGCERYGVNKRTSLIIRTLVDGTITFTEIDRVAYTPFRE